jgi:NDP-sugar pyrophosphorylase family protein
MVEVLGKPFIDYQLAFLKECGCKEVILCIGMFGNQIREHVGDGSEFGIYVHYSDDGTELRGTGGAVQNAYRILPIEFMVMNGDSYLDINYKTVVNRYMCENNPLLMTVYPTAGTNLSGNVSIKDGKLVKYDKSGTSPDMNYIDFGLTVMKRRLLNLFSQDRPFDFGEIYSRLISNNQASYYVSPKIFHEIGSFEGLTETEQYINRIHRV